MADPASYSLGWSRQATPLVPDGTVHITTRPAVPLSDEAAQSVYAQSKENHTDQPDAALQWEGPMTQLELPSFNEGNAGTPNAELQHMSTSDLDLQEFWTQGFDEAALESVIAAEQESPALTHNISNSFWQHESGMVIDNAAAALQDFADLASTNPSAQSHSRAAFDSNHTLSGGFVTFDPAELMDQSLSMSEMAEPEASVQVQKPNTRLSLSHLVELLVCVVQRPIHDVHDAILAVL